MRLAALAAVATLLSAAALRAQEAPPAAEREEEPAPPKFLLKGFGDVNYRYSRNGSPNTFRLGQLDLFITSELSPDLSVLAEIVLEPGEEDEQLIDLERYQIKYSPSDVFSVALGRMHTVLGYWNQTCHHGTWFQTTARRPQIYRFEDEGGLLPVHEVGVQFLGAKGVPGLTLEYNLSLSNGRGATTTDIPTFQDKNASKAVNLWVGLAPKGVPGLKFGGVSHFDTIPTDPSNPERVDALKERIFGGFLAYDHTPVEVLAEWFHLTHEDAHLGRSWVMRGGYAQASYRLGRFRPYYRFDLVDPERGDPFFAPNDTYLRRHTAGLRIDPRAWAALKVEISHDHPDSGKDFGSATLQVAFTF